MEQPKGFFKKFYVNQLYSDKMAKQKILFVKMILQKYIF